MCQFSESCTSQHNKCSGGRKKGEVKEEGGNNKVKSNVQAATAGVTEGQVEMLCRPWRDYLSRDLPSRGSALHSFDGTGTGEPHGCVPCRFHCHSFDVQCRKAWYCDFCHVIEDHASHRGKKKIEMMKKKAEKDPNLHSV